MVKGDFQLLSNLDSIFFITFLDWVWFGFLKSQKGYQLQFVGLRLRNPMGSSSRRSLELKLMGCKGLQAFNFFQKLKVLAVVSLTSDTPGDKHHHPLQQQQQRTKTDAEGDKDPEWNHEMRFDLDAVSREDCDHLYLHIDLRYEFFGDKSLGEVRVPLTDLVCDSTTGLGEHGENCGVARFVSYEVRTHEKKPNGVITFSYKVVNPLHGVGGSATATATATSTTTPAYGYIDGYTVVTPVDDDHHHHHHSNHDQNTTAAAAGGYSTVNHVNGDLLHQQQQQNQNQHHHHHHQSDHDHDQHLQSPYGRADQEFSYQYSAVESTAYGIHYPSLEPPPYLPTPAGEGYMSYSRFDHHQFQYPPPPPPFHPPPELTRISSHPFPPPQPPPPELTRISSDPFPPPPPPLHHHHHHHHVAHGAVYPPPATGDLYEQSYGMPSSIYYNGDGTPRY